MAFQLIALGALIYAMYYAMTMTNESNKVYLNARKITPITPSAFVGYDEPSNTWVDPLMVTFNAPHLPIGKIEAGPYGVPRIIYSSQYGESQIPLFGHNIEKI